MSRALRVCCFLDSWFTPQGGFAVRDWNVRLGVEWTLGLGLSSGLWVF